jgi:hypothetical protein
MFRASTNFQCSSNRRRSTPSLRIAVLIALFALVPTVAFSVGKQPKETNGNYKVKVGGTYEGSGTAHIGSKKVNIHLSIEDENGNEGSLIANAMDLSGDHFEGKGKVMGVKATFIGRIDGYDQDTHFRGARLLCSFIDENGKGGRIAGPLEK